MFIKKVAQIKGELFWRELFSGHRCRTVIAAPSTFSARVEIENALPGELVDPANAQCLFSFDFSFNIFDGRQPTPGVEVLGEYIGHRGDHMEVF